MVVLVGGGFFVGGAFAPTPTQTVTYLVVLIASVLWAFGLIILVSQRLTAEDREANENLKLVFNTSPDATVIGRPRDGAIVDVAASSSPLKAAKRRRFQLNQEAGRKRVAGAHASG